MNKINEPVPGQTSYRISQILRRVREHGTWRGLAVVPFVISAFLYNRHNRLPLLRNVECQQHSYFDLLIPFPHKDCGDLSWAVLLLILFFILFAGLPILFATLAKLTLALSAYAGNDGANLEMGLSICPGEDGIDLNSIESRNRLRDKPSAPKKGIKNSISNWLTSMWKALRRRRRSKAITHFSAIPRASKYWTTAQFELGCIHIYGETPGSRSAAIAHFTQAADAGHQMSALELGLQIMEEDPEQAKDRLIWGLADDHLSGKTKNRSSELRDKATLALAWLSFIGTSNDRRDTHRSMILVRNILGFDDSAITSSQQNTTWFRREFIASGKLLTGAHVVRTLIDTDERAEQVRREREKARAELYSFITHSIPSAMSTVVAETEESLEIVQGEFLASKEVRDHLIRSLSSALGRAGFIDNLMSTHKLLIAGKERLQLAWESESADYESPLLVVIDATKQALAQTLFADREYAQIDLDRSDDDQINRMRELSLAQLTGTTTNESLAEFLRFVSSELPFLSFDCKPDVAWRVKRGGIRFSVLVSVVSELMRNALRYREYRSPLIVRIEDRGGIVSVVLINTIAKNGTQRLRVTNRGLAFIREFAEAISELTFSSSATESTHTATLCVSDGSNK